MALFSFRKKNTQIPNQTLLFRATNDHIIFSPSENCETSLVQLLKQVSQIIEDEELGIFQDGKLFISHDVVHQVKEEYGDLLHFPEDFMGIVQINIHGLINRDGIFIVPSKEKLHFKFSTFFQRYNNNRANHL